MDIATFESSLAYEHPPEELHGVLLALWLASKGKWEKAHDLVQDDPSPEAAWVHAYLHRVEGDTFNAGYWYRRAGKPVATTNLKEEWQSISSTLLQQFDL